MVINSLLGGGLNSGGTNSSDDQIDYSKFKTPYYKIEIAKSSGEFQELPMQLLKLISKIEIMETIDRCAHNQIKISFIEGSREPYSKTQGTSADIYEGGDFSNHTGFIVDLKTIDNGTVGGSLPGFSLASTVGDLIGTASQALQAGQDLTEVVSDPIGAAAGALGIGGSFNSEGEDIVDKESVPNDKQADFLFFPRNRIRVTWGYAEDSEYRRTFVGSITMLQTNFPENGHPITDIIAHGGTSELDQLTTKKGKIFKATGSAEQFLGSIAKQLDVAGEDEDISIAALLETIKTTSGFEVIKSSSFDAETLDPGKAKNWAAGQSLHQFLGELARRHNAIYTVVNDFSTAKPAIIFIRREEFNSTTIIPKNLMNYRQPGSILKSVNIRADFSRIVGKVNVGVSEEKSKVIRGRSPQGYEKIIMFEGQKALDIDPTTGTSASDAGKGINKLADGGTSGNVEYSPENSVANLKETAANEAACNYSHVVSLEFVTLGFPNVKPGSAPFQGLGSRYSGFYSIKQVSHIIDSNGYVCRGIATGAGSGADGVEVPVKGEELTGGSEAVKLFNAKTNTKSPQGGTSSSISFDSASNLLDSANSLLT